MKFIIFCIFSFYTVLLGNSFNNLCVNHSKYQICPNEKSKVIDTLSLFKEKEISNEQKTQISFNNIQVLDKLVKFLIVPDFDGYMTIIHVNSNGEKKQFFPSESMSDDYVKKGQLIDLSYNENKVNSDSTEGLEYFIVVITSKRVYFNVAEKNVIYDAFSDEKMFNEIINDIKSNKYGKYFLKLLPYYILKETE